MLLVDEIGLSMRDCVIADAEFPTHDLPWEDFHQAKISYEELLLNLFADWWDEAGGNSYPLPAVATQHDLERVFDLRARQWLTDDFGPAKR